MQRFGQQLLLALDYAHESGVIHTAYMRLKSDTKEIMDIQPQNIMLQIPDLSIIDDYLQKTTPGPEAYDSNSMLRRLRLNR
ncbi:hypothetical protein N7493_009642 [Penicillium malachiteum]|uniref:Protein kinase domain-containing protein n=1 Tax=Penicillium malachiteum TaxID=1324776 RepID=A0AAD6HEZ6_9EURO|nr:hypothetical protein N7493_009642 [Penicillium malachiteum]